jgi:phosphate starvation-inducible protein PhoH and related proteins
LKPHLPADGESRTASIQIKFDDNKLLPLLFGEFDQNLARIEQKLDVRLSSRGNRVSAIGRDAAIAREVLNRLYGRLTRGLAVDKSEVDAVIRLALSDADKGAAAAPEGELSVKTPRRHISARSIGQRAYIDALRSNELVFGVGPAGTGKTYLAVAVAVSMMMSGKVDRIILSRPAVEAGERLGFLPGDLKDKIDPYLRPLYDALYDMLPPDQVVKRLTTGEIEVAPLAFMRGRTLANAFVILDEAQNTTPVQMKMFLTRLGENSRMAVTGDPSQADLPIGAVSGLNHALATIREIESIGRVTFTDVDVVRHPLVTRIVRAYEDDDRRRAQAKGRRTSPDTASQ